ncbi:MAG: ATP-dependent DNA helicase RecQ [Ferruginibacter sp.]
MTIQQVLKEYWGYDDFRPLQEDIIRAVLDGKDTLALLPTGGGKSICFQVPAMAKEGICLVVSPLIALIKDQVEQLRRRNIPALAIYSGMSFQEVKKTMQNAVHGNFKFLYVSPERLETRLFLDYLPSLNISLIAVDEAHCISQWGYDFRPPYLRIAVLREQLHNIPVLALTASATKKVQDDICEKLQFGKTQQRFRQSFQRPELSYSVFNAPSKQNKLLEILRNVPGTAIVYCKSRKHTKDIAELLRTNHINADHYHAGLNNAERSSKQEDWISNKTRVIVCTNAFGMGIDKPDVRVVVHYDVPDCLENYYQEAGRAGRDGKRSYAVLLYSNKELEDLQQQAGIRFPDEASIKTVYTALMNNLQVAAGSGDGSCYDFDIGSFSKNFKLSILTATYAIKALEQEDILSFSDAVFKPSTCFINVNRNDLADFETMHPEMEDLIKGLLRSYGGIFDYPVIVNEMQLAKFIRKDIGAVNDALKRLNEYGIITYTPQKDKPQVTLLQNRMYNDSYRIDMTGYKLRKKNFEERVAGMVSYIKETKPCRSKVIAAYFDAPIDNNCGICDNCISQKNQEISAKEFDHISGSIIAAVKARPMPLKDIYVLLKDIKKEKTMKVIQFLQSENRIRADKDGTIFHT